MKKVLIYYSNYELVSDAKKSVPRLLASLISYLEKYTEVTFFSFEDNYKDASITSQPVTPAISASDKVLRKANNLLPFRDKMTVKEVKKRSVIKHLDRQAQPFDVVIVLSIFDISMVRSKYPGASLIYWFHDLTLLKPEVNLLELNKADHVVSPSITSFKRVLQKVEPSPLTARFHYIPNWTNSVFSSPDKGLAVELKERYSISDKAKVLIFTGGEDKLKGGFLVRRAIEKLSTQYDDLVFLIAGTRRESKVDTIGNLRIIEIGFLNPSTLSAFYSISHVGIFSSLGYEHSPLTLLEMIDGNVLPVSSNIGGTKEILGEHYPYLVDVPQSVEEWTEKIKSALELSSEDKKNHLENLQEGIVDKYNEQNSLKKFLEVVQSN